MENIEPWQYVVIGGPCFFLGVLATSAYLHKTYLDVLALEQRLLAKKKEQS